jgi:hypothetical protein
MDILNFISWIASKRRVVTSVPDDSLIPVGIRTPQRDDKYTTVAIKKTDLISSGIPTLQQVVNASSSISNFGGLGQASITSVNFTTNRALYLNNDNYPTILLVDNLNSANTLQIDLDTLTLDGVPYTWSSIVSGSLGPIGPQGIQGIQGLVGPTGPQGVAGPVGAAGLTFVGAFNNTLGYSVDDVVFFSGSSYVALANIPAPIFPAVLPNPNVDTVNWNFLAIQGLTGPQGPQGIPGPAAFTRYVGEPYQGGIIVEVWKDNLGVEHGLIMSYVNLAVKVWSNVNIAGATSVSNGLANSNAIVAQAGHTTSMALDCLNYTNINYGTGIYSDWYLPAVGEMMSLIKNRVIIDDAIVSLGATAISSLQYWTSTGTSSTAALMGSQATLQIGAINKNNAQPGRPFRKF